ncbi:MAG: PqqD family peptide modification chaperone [Acidimicrobiales bacterium]|nr:PqqD family peptide modification chaperone [Acidimicrobiales bacterium]
MDASEIGSQEQRDHLLTSPDDIDAGFVPHPNESAEEVAVAGGIVLLDGWRAASALNDVGALIWSCFDGERSLGAIVEELSGATGATAAEILPTVLAVTRQLGLEGFVRGVGFPDDPDWRLVPIVDLDVGEVVDDSNFTDLSGEDRTLAHLRGTEALLVNWSPDCGYCWAIAERLAVLVEPLSEKGVQLVLLAGGTAEANRVVAESVGLTCPMLVRTGGDDPFRGRGTPSCYHLDIAGRLISPIASGAESVLAMASELAGVDPISLLDDPLSDPAPAGTRYLLADNGACAPSSGSGPVTTWAGTRTYRLGDFHFGLRYDSDSTAGVLDALFGGGPVRDRRAGYSYSVALPGAAVATGTEGVSRELDLLVAGGRAQVRSRHPSRVLRALLWRLQDDIFGHEVPAGRLRVKATAVRVGDAAVLLQDTIDAFGSGFQARLARLGVALADVRFPEIDLATAELVVGEPRLDHDPAVLARLDRTVDSPAELPPVVPGRYPLLGWGVVWPGEHRLVEMAPWEAAAATLSLLWEAEDPPARLRDLGDLFTRIRGFGLWYHSEAELVEVVSGAVSALTAGTDLRL